MSLTCQLIVIQEAQRLGYLVGVLYSWLGSSITVDFSNTTGGLIPSEGLAGIVLARQSHGVSFDVLAVNT